MLLATAILLMAGCRTMSAAKRPIEESRTYQAATGIDSEPHVFSFTMHAPTYKIDFNSPRSLAWSMVPAGIGEVVSAEYKKRTGRSLAFHMVGHCVIELKSVDPKTGKMRYLLTAVTDARSSETFEQLIRDKVGFGITDRGTKGKLETAEKDARDIDEAAEVGIRAARLRVLISEQTAQRMFDYYEEFERKRMFDKFALASYPLDGTGVGCTSYAASFLDIAGLLEPQWQTEWQHRFLVPQALVGDPDLGTKTPVRRLLFGPRNRRWATENEPNHPLSFYDTTKMYDWIIRMHGTPSGRLPPGYLNGEIEKKLGEYLAMPVVTVDMRNRPTPTGPFRRITPAIGSNAKHSE